MEGELSNGRYDFTVSGRGKFEFAYVGRDRGMYAFTRPGDSCMKVVNVHPEYLTKIDEHSFKVGPRGTIEHVVGSDDFKKYKQVWEASADDSK
jgi:hypothetical protein|tara:strand:+ start:212 stop:490 length:279 start_codon:yes stop_codon:yes gene_type:complete